MVWHRQPIGEVQVAWLLGLFPGLEIKAGLDQEKLLDVVYCKHQAVTDV